MLRENVIITAADKVLLEKNKNKFKRQLNEQKTVQLLPQCSAPAFDIIYRLHLKAQMEKCYLLYYLKVYVPSRCY